MYALILQSGDVTITLLPGTGLRLPGSEVDLRFGMSQGSAREALPVSMVMASVFACRSAWAVGGRLQGRFVSLSATTDEGGLSSVGVSGPPSAGDSYCPVAYDGIDLFGWPAPEVIEALRTDGHPVKEYRSGNVWVGPMHLLASAVNRGEVPDRNKPRRRPPPVFGSVSLYGPDARSTAELFDAMDRRDVAAVRDLLSVGTDPNAVDPRPLPFPWPALAYAACGGQAEVVRLLLAHGAAVDARDPGGGTALIGACNAAHLGTARLLLEAGADVSLRNDSGYTAYGRTPIRSHRLHDLLRSYGADEFL